MAAASSSSSSSAEAKRKTITLRSSDGEMFEVTEAVAMKSETISHMIEDVGADGVIPLPNVTSGILAKVVEYCNMHVDSVSSSSSTFFSTFSSASSSFKTAAAATDDDADDGIATAAAEATLKAWDKEFVNVDQSTLFELILAANYLNIKGLLDLTCQTVADMIKGKTPQEVRDTFNIHNDLSPEEEARIRQENQWAFE